MRSRRLTAEKLKRIARPLRIMGIILILLGLFLWVTAALSLIPLPPFGVIFGGVLVAGGITLITASL